MTLETRVHWSLVDHSEDKARGSIGVRDLVAVDSVIVYDAVDQLESIIADATLCNIASVHVNNPRTTGLPIPPANQEAQVEIKARIDYMDTVTGKTYWTHIAGIDISAVEFVGRTNRLVDDNGGWVENLKTWVNAFATSELKNPVSFLSATFVGSRS